MESLGDKISAYRQNLKMTQEELAAKLGVTPQAISKWERNQSYPDIFTFAQICKILKVSSDLLLETECNHFSESPHIVMSNEIKNILRNCEEPLVLEFGGNLVDIFLKEPYAKYIKEQRSALAKTGLILPVMCIRDNLELSPDEFMVLSYHRVLYSEQVEHINEHTLQHIVKTAVDVIRKNYGYILNRDIVKMMVDNLKLQYPALITNIVPEKISYGLLQKVLIGLLERGQGLCYMIKTIEVIEDRLQECPHVKPEELISAVAEEIEREDNYWVVMKKRYNRDKV